MQYSKYRCVCERYTHIFISKMRLHWPKQCVYTFRILIETFTPIDWLIQRNTIQLRYNIINTIDCIGIFISNNKNIIHLALSHSFTIARCNLNLNCRESIYRHCRLNRNNYIPIHMSLHKMGVNLFIEFI